jgi:hypothetical protein
MNNSPMPAKDGQAPARRFGGCVAIIIILVGYVCLAGGWFLFSRNSMERLQTSWYLQSNGKTAEGVIANMEQESSARPGDNVVYRLVVEYDVDGETYTVRSYAAYGALATYKVGDSIDVIYDPDDPANAQVDIFMERWLEPFLSTLPF